MPLYTETYITSRKKAKVIIYALSLDANWWFTEVEARGEREREEEKEQQ